MSGINCSRAAVEVPVRARQVLFSFHDVLFWASDSIGTSTRTLESKKE